MCGECICQLGFCCLNCLKVARYGRSSFCSIDQSTVDQRIGTTENGQLLVSVPRFPPFGNTLPDLSAQSAHMKLGTRSKSRCHGVIASREGVAPGDETSDPYSYPGIGTVLASGGNIPYVLFGQPMRSINWEPFVRAYSRVAAARALKSYTRPSSPPAVTHEYTNALQLW